MRARIDISEVETQTKIRAKYLRALENEEWDLLPGSVFVKSFLRTYSDYLGLDTRLLIDEYRLRYERPSDHESRPPAAPVTGRERSRSGRGQRPPRSRLPASPALAVVLVIVVIGVLLYLLGRGNNSGSGSGTAITHPAQTGTTGADHHRSHQRTNGTTGAPGPGSTPPVPVVPKDASLRVVPTGPIYICAERPGGVIIVANTFDVGETVQTMKGKKLLVTFGTANAQVKVNGKPYTLTSTGRPIALEITPTGAKTISTGPTCT